MGNILLSVFELQKLRMKSHGGLVAWGREEVLGLTPIKSIFCDDVKDPVELQSVVEIG